MSQDNNKQEEQLTNLIRQSGMESPSFDFTARVMQAVHENAFEKQSVKGKYIWWIAGLLMGCLVLAGIVLNTFLQRGIVLILTYLESVFVTIGSMFNSYSLDIKSFTISPLLALIVVALSLLLLLDQWFMKNKQTAH